MSRWGEEEKKSKGIFGCLTAVIVSGMVIYGFMQVYPVLEGRRKLETSIEKIARAGHKSSEEKIRADIRASMKDLEIPADPEDLFVEKARKPWGEGGSITTLVTVRLEYEASADFVLFKYSLPMVINEVVPLIEF